MSILSLITVSLLACVQRPRRWFVAPSRPRCGHRLPSRIGDRHRHSPQKPEWLKHEILRLKALMPEAGCCSIADICNRRFAASRNVTVGKTFVHQTLQRHDYEIQVLRRRLKHAKPITVPRNLIWGLDLTGKTDAGGRLHPLLGVIDHGSRALLHLHPLRDKTAQTLIACLNEIICAYGKPKVIRTDNEAIFTPHIFRRGLKRLGIRHQRTDPGCPWQNGRIERLFGTLKQKLDQWQVSDFSQLNHDLDLFSPLVQPHPPAPEPRWQGAGRGVERHGSLQDEAATRILVRCLGWTADGVPSDKAVIQR